MRRIVASAVMMAVLAVALAGCSPAAPKKPTVPVAAPAVSQFDQGVAAFNRGDYSTAYRLFRPLADQGYASAQFNLGLMYDNGQGVPQDYAAAVSWYRKAADQGNAKAQFNLGYDYANGQGVPQDYVQAHMWANLAAASGYADAVKNRDIFAAKMTPAQIAEAQRLASAWKPTK